MNATADFCSNGVTWTQSQEQQLRTEREENRREYARFKADGTLPRWIDSAVEFENQIAVMYENSELRQPGVPIVHNIGSNGTVTITAGEDDLRRVVIQPSGLIALELASPDVAEKFVDAFNAYCKTPGRYAEAIDYREVYLRARAAGF